MSKKEPSSTEAGDFLNEEVFSIFIFKIGPQSMKAAENYLKNRNWTVGSASGMREALAYIIQKKPQFVMVAADHPNKKVRIFPKLITQAFPVKVIAFAEGANTNAMNSLREMGLSLTLFPPVSGPSIERLVRKVLKEEKETAERIQRGESPTEGGTAPDAGSAQDGTIRLKGGSTPAGDMQKSFDQAREALMALANAGDDDESGPAYMPSQNSPAPGSPGYMPNQGSGTPGSPGYMPHEQSSQKGSEAYGNTSSSEQNDNPAVQFQQGGTALTPELEAEQRGLRAKSYQAQQAGPEGKDFNLSEQGPTSAAHNATQTGPGGSGGAGYTPQQGSKPQSHGYNPSHNHEASDWETPDQASADREKNSNQNSNSQDEEAQQAQKQSSKIGSSNIDTGAQEKASRKQPNANSTGTKEGTQATKLYVKGVEKQLADNDTLIIKGSVEAMDLAATEVRSQASADDNLSETAAIATTDNVHCITVDSPRFSGYLVAALGKKRAIDEQFIETIKARLFKFLRSNGEALSEENPFDIKIKEVPFEDWAIQQAEFLRKSIHNGEEIAMAFFPTQEVALKLEPSGNDKMIQISLDELAEDVALDFDLYIYMPENNKFLLYTPEGKPLYGKQKLRLKEKGLTHMHLRKDSINSVKKYRAQNFLNSKIETYRNDPKNRK